MKKNRIFGALSVATLLFAGACSNDIIDPGKQTNGTDGVNPEDGVFLAVNFDLPSAKGTRSYTDGDNTSSGGIEVGQNYENTVKTALIVLAKTDNSFIAASYSEDPYAIDAEGASYRSTAKISKTNLSKYYSSESFDTDDKGNHLINVFVFANPTKALMDLFNPNGGIAVGNKSWINSFGVYDVSFDGKEETRIWTPNKFLMANSSICTRSFPNTLDEWTNYNSDINAFNLTGMNNYGRPNQIDNLTNRGNIEVERAAARYDFRDGALDGGDGLTDPNLNGFAAQSYHMLLDSEGEPLVDIYLGKMSLVNMNKNFYFLRRVSNDGYGSATNGESSNNLQILGVELPWYKDAVGNWLTTDGNYIVDAFADWKCEPGSTAAPQSGFKDKFNYPFFTDNDGNGELYENLNEGNIVDTNGLGADAIDNASSRWYTSMLSDVLNDENQEDKSGKYKIWRYLTEGTIPGINSQKNCVSNGIVFKGLLKPAYEPKEDDGKDYFTHLLLNTLKVNSEKGNDLHSPIIYMFQNHLYCTWEHIRRTAIYLSLTELRRVDGKWTFKIERTTKLYSAVFGNGGFGSVTFNVNGPTEIKDADFLVENGEFTLEDDLAPEATSANSLYNAWKAKFPSSDEHVEEKEAEEMEYFTAFRNAAVNVGKIALYQESYDEDLGGWGYYCYYYYWNRHNDNGQEGVMGPMEFAVVRNNVYKLAVTKVVAVGHPGITANDPDKPNNDTPDESGDVYITVSCTTLPWVVRENTITF